MLDTQYFETGHHLHSTMKIGKLLTGRSNSTRHKLRLQYRSLPPLILYFQHFVVLSTWWHRNKNHTQNSRGILFRKFCPLFRWNSTKNIAWSSFQDHLRTIGKFYTEIRIEIWDLLEWTLQRCIDHNRQIFQAALKSQNHIFNSGSIRIEWHTQSINR